MRTKTPSNGLHIIFGIRSDDFPSGGRTREYWSEQGNGKGKGHNQVNLMGTGYYVVERGPSYESINDLECLVTLSKIQVEELLNILGYFESETRALRNVCSKLVQYYQPTNRQNISLRVPGYLHKHGVPEYLIFDLIEHLIGLTGGDEESEKRYQAVRDTCTKDANSDLVSGYSKLLEAVYGDLSVMMVIQEEFNKLGYSFHASDGNGEVRTSATRNTGGDQDRDSEDKDLSAIVFELLEPHIELLFKNKTDDRAFAAIHVNGHREIVPIHKSKRFDLWIRKTYYDKTKDTLGSDILKEVVDTLGAKALFDGPEKTLELRISKDPQDNTVYWYDLCNESWEAIRITRDGWNIVKSGEVPIMFRRYSSQQAQVYPSKNYPPDIMDQFLALINLKDSENARLLVKCYIVSILVPGIAKTILMIHGPKGAAKTAFQVELA